MKVCMCSLCFVAVIFAGYISPSLEKIMTMTEPNEYITVNIHLQERADLSTFSASATPEEKVAYLKTFASATQAPLLEYLGGLNISVTDIHPWWIANVITLRAQPTAIPAIASRSDVDYVVEDIIVEIDRAALESTPDVLVAAWNIAKVQADSCWNAGYDGRGVVLGNIDTGVYTSHSGFGGRWRTVDGWFDGVNGQATPYDDHGHGTHTMGTICGGTYSGTEYGVAKGAPFICAKGLNASGSGSSMTLRPCFQWYANLGSRSARAVGNSWGSPTQTSLEYWDDCINLKSLGIMPVFSIGNDGPGGGTAGTPGNYPSAFGVGATDNADNIASYSSRGPAPNQAPWNDTRYWPRADWNLIKPNLSAPGSSVTSFSPSGGLATMSGTSMASPHVTGAIAILLQKNPTLDFTALYNLLLDNIDRPTQGAPYPNNNYGWGRLNVWKACRATTATTKPVLVYDRNTVTGGNGNGRLDPGETANLNTYIGNIGNQTATNVRGTLRENDPYITISDSNGTYRNLAANDTASNTADPFVVTASATTPDGYIANFSLFLQCAESSYTRSFTLMVGTPQVFYATSHGVGNCSLTVCANGAVGFTKSNQTLGRGFRYPKPGNNTLYFGSVAAGNSGTYVVDAYYEGSSVDDSDWVCIDSIRPVIPPTRAMEEFRGSYKDLNHPQTKGLRCYQHSYGLNTDSTGYDDWTIIAFDMANEGTANINNLDCGLFIDFDIGAGNTNYAAVDAARRTVHVRNSQASYNPTVGIRLISPRTARNASVIDHALYVYPFGGLPDTLVWKFLDGTITLASANRNYDWSVMVSAGPYSLAPGSRQKFVFAVVGGTSQAAFNANSDSAQAWWDRLLGSEEELSQPGTAPFTINISPNPFNQNAKIRFYNAPNEKISVKIYDVTGTCVQSHKVLPKKREMNISALGLSNGIYFVRIESRQRTLIEKIVLVK